MVANLFWNLCGLLGSVIILGLIILIVGFVLLCIGAGIAGWIDAARSDKPKKNTKDSEEDKRL